MSLYIILGKILFDLFIFLEYNDYMIKQVTDNLYRSNRPCYHDFHPTLEEVELWVLEAQEHGVKSILCLLSSELDLYEEVLPQGLLGYYKENGFSVYHIPVTDYKSPALNEKEVKEVLAAYAKLPKPVLIHCSAGIDRTGCAVKAVLGKARNKL